MLPLGRTASVETDTIDLQGREWTMGPRPGEVEEHIAGYGVRVLDEGGAVLAEKYGPPSIKGKIDWKHITAPKEQPKHFPLRRRKKKSFRIDPDQDAGWE
jgi:hypothetical protein